MFSNPHQVDRLTPREKKGFPRLSLDGLKTSIFDKCIKHLSTFFLPTSTHLYLCFRDAWLNRGAFALMLRLCSIFLFHTIAQHAGETPQNAHIRVAFIVQAVLRIVFRGAPKLLRLFPTFTPGSDIPQTNSPKHIRPVVVVDRQYRRRFKTLPTLSQAALGSA